MNSYRYYLSGYPKKMKLYNLKAGDIFEITSIKKFKHIICRIPRYYQFKKGTKKLYINIKRFGSKVTYAIPIQTEVICYAESWHQFKRKYWYKLVRSYFKQLFMKL